MKTKQQQQVKQPKLTALEKLKLKRQLAEVVIRRAKQLSVYTNTEQKGAGICDEIGSAFCNAVDELELTREQIEHSDVYSRMRRSMLNRASKTWPKFSGRLAFPIPDRTGRATADYMYDCFLLWDTTDYGDDRRELAAHCVTRFTATWTRINNRIASYEK